MRYFFKPLILCYLLSPLFAFSLFTTEFFSGKTISFDVHDTVFCLAIDEDNQRIFYGCDDSCLYCSDFRGNHIWRHRIDDWVYGVAYNFKNERVFCGSENGILYCFNTKGELLWRHIYENFNTIYGIACDPKKGLVFCGVGGLYCLDSNGKEVWKFEFEHEVGEVLVTYDSKNKRVFCSPTASTIYCFDSQGKLLWKYGEGEKRCPYFTSPESWFSGHVALDAQNDTIYCILNNSLFCLSSDGKKIWKYQADAAICGVVLDPINQSIILGMKDFSISSSSKGNFLCCLGFDGEFIWSLPVPTIIKGIDCKNHRVYCGHHVITLRSVYFGHLNQGLIKNLKETLISLDEVTSSFINEENVIYAFSQSGDFFRSGQKTSENHEICGHWKSIDFTTLSNFSPDGKVAFLSQDGRLILLNKEGDISFQSMCRFSNWPEFNCHASSPPVIDAAGNCYFTSELGLSYCINKNKEALQEDQIFPFFSDNTQVIPSLDCEGHLYWVIIQDHQTITWFDCRKKTRLARFTCKEDERPLACSFLIGRNNELFFVTTSNYLCCVNFNGELSWSYPLPYTVNSRLLMTRSGCICFECEDGKLYSVNPHEKEIESYLKFSGFPGTAFQSDEIMFPVWDSQGNLLKVFYHLIPINEPSL